MIPSTFAGATTSTNRRGLAPRAARAAEGKVARAPTTGSSRYRVQYALHSRRRDRLQKRLRARPRRHRVKAPRLAAFRPLDSMGKSEEPECTGGET